MTDVLKQKAVKLCFAIFHAHTIDGVDDPNYRVGLLEIIPPVGSQCPLAPDIP